MNWVHDKELDKETNESKKLFLTSFWDGGIIREKTSGVVIMSRKKDHKKRSTLRDLELQMNEKKMLFCV